MLIDVITAKDEFSDLETMKMLKLLTWGASSPQLVGTHILGSDVELLMVSNTIG